MVVQFYELKHALTDLGEMHKMKKYETTEIKEKEGLKMVKKTGLIQNNAEKNRDDYSEKTRRHLL